MKIDLNYIANIKTFDELKKYDLDKPIFMNNYLFHYLILLGNLKGLKLYKFKIFEYNADSLSGFSLAAKLPDTDILEYLIETYPEYIYNVDGKRHKFTFYLLFDNMLKLMEKYKDLDWNDLFINSEAYFIFFSNANYKQISLLLELLKTDILEYSVWITSNNILKHDELVKILDKLSFEELNKKDEFNIGVLSNSLYYDNKELFDYLLKKNVDFDYPFKMQNDANNLLYSNTLHLAVLTDRINNKLYYSKKLIELAKNKYSKDDFYNFIHQINSFGMNILHIIFIHSYNNSDKINDKYFIDLLGEDGLNHKNDNKIAPIMLMSSSRFIKKYRIEKSIYENIKDKIKIKIKPDENISDIKEIKSNYVNYNIFNSYEHDVLLYSHIIHKKYDNVLLLKQKDEFSYILKYTYPDKLDMNKYLTKLIIDNKNGNKRFFFIFLIITIKDINHANILIGDYKNNTIEHFETYGLLFSSYYKNDLLEEELTWSTGMKYIKSDEFLPNIAFQALSDNKMIENKKHGDIDGFCLAWCVWYLECRLLNPDINPKDLVNKLMKIISKSDNSFIEHIRNYANKLTKEKVKILKKIDINKKDISNVYMSDINIKKIIKYCQSN